MFPGEFTLNETTGVVSTATGLDYESRSSFVLKVEADSITVASSNLRVPSKSESNLFKSNFIGITLSYAVRGVQETGSITAEGGLSLTGTGSATSFLFVSVQMERK